MIDCIALFIAADTGSPQASASAFRAPPFTKSGHSMMSQTNDERAHAAHNGYARIDIFIYLFKEFTKIYLSQSFAKLYICRYLKRRYTPSAYLRRFKWL
jgi:hypothetical protein